MCRSDMCTRHELPKECSGIDGLQVEVLMILEVDNKGTVGLANIWSFGGQTRHVFYFRTSLGNLKKMGS